MSRKPFIKICCIGSIQEAMMAIDAGTSALGLVGHMPSGPGVIDDGLIRMIAAAVPPPVATFLLTSETIASGIIRHHRKVNTSTLQLVDVVKPGSYAQIRKALPSVKIVQVIHVAGKGSVDEALAVAGEVDALLLDSGNPFLKIKILGGTGLKHDWRISREIIEKSGVPVFLAGGLNPENVREAIDTVAPFGLDLCNGVRTDGKLDAGKLEAFFRVVEG
ncbi:MAG: phosphoribosylanthranilate isomerase [Cyclobacteriaceae bacterium]|nr:phosphoribosylanthranilate isomerase [Cyclobacteriaceae bacterium]